MEFKEDDLVELYIGGFWRVDSIDKKMESLRVESWDSEDIIFVQFSDVMNRWVAKPL